MYAPIQILNHRNSHTNMLRILFNIFLFKLVFRKYFSFRYMIYVLVLKISYYFRLRVKYFKYFILDILLNINYYFRLKVKYFKYFILDILLNI